MVNASFADDFAKYTKEDWNATYLYKAQEKLQRCKSQINW